MQLFSKLLESFFHLLGTLAGHDLETWQ